MPGRTKCCPFRSAGQLERAALRANIGSYSSAVAAGGSSTPYFFHADNFRVAEIYRPISH
jgi:hypothetical protein